MGKVGSLGKGVYMQAAWDEELRKAGEWPEEIGATGMKVEWGYRKNPLSPLSEISNRNYYLNHNRLN